MSEQRGGGGHGSPSQWLHIQLQILSQPPCFLPPLRWPPPVTVTSALAANEKHGATVTRSQLTSPSPNLVPYRRRASLRESSQHPSPHLLLECCATRTPYFAHLIALHCGLERFWTGVVRLSNPNWKCRSSLSEEYQLKSAQRKGSYS